MAVKMVANYHESGCIYQISYHNMLLLGFWTQNEYIMEEKRYKQK